MTSSFRIPQNFAVCDNIIPTPAYSWNPIGLNPSIFKQPVNLRSTLTNTPFFLQSFPDLSSFKASLQTFNGHKQHHSLLSITTPIHKAHSITTETLMKNFYYRIIDIQWFSIIFKATSSFMQLICRFLYFVDSEVETYCLHKPIYYYQDKAKSNLEKQRFWREAALKSC